MAATGLHASQGEDQAPAIYEAGRRGGRGNTGGESTGEPGRCVYYAKKQQCYQLLKPLGLPIYTFVIGVELSDQEFLPFSSI